MKITLTHSSNLPWKDELYNTLEHSSLHELHKIFFPHQDGVERQMTRDVVKDSDVILAEVSYPSTGQGIELGWANIFNVPIICISKKGSKVSNSLKYIANIFIVYSDMDDMIQKLSTQLANVTY